MKNRNRRKFIKSSLLLIAVAALLVAAVGGTVAYLVTNTSPVVNTFTPADVSTEIKETFVNNVKSSITVKNEGDIPVYVRVALVGNWCKDEDGNTVIVDAYTPSFALGSNWINVGDGYYYYTTPLGAGGTTSDLLGTSITEPVREDGAHLEITVLQQSIQAEPTTAVVDAWHVTLDGTTITAATGN